MVGEFGLKFQTTTESGGELLKTTECLFSHPSPLGQGSKQESLSRITSVMAGMRAARKKGNSIERIIGMLDDVRA